MKVLVTGATTPLGTALVDALLAADDVELVLAVGHERESPGSDQRCHRSLLRAALIRLIRLTLSRLPRAVLGRSGSRYRCNAAGRSAARRETVKDDELLRLLRTTSADNFSIHSSHGPDVPDSNERKDLLHRDADDRRGPLG